MSHRFNLRQLLLLGSASLLGATLFSACTLITDVDREDIPVPAPPTFPEDDAGRDAAVPPPVEPEDGGSGDAGEVVTDAGADAAPDAGGAVSDAGGGDAG